jgi:enterochelin esterase-like enzyme
MFLFEHRGRARSLLARLIGIGLCLCAAGLPLAAEGSGGKAVVSPEVMHTEAAPTGYEVTFRYYAPQAERVQIKGEWAFSTPDGKSGLTPSQWVVGAYPAGDWPVADMTKGKDGVWTYTIPLPSGVFTYSFYVNNQEADVSKAQSLSDPSNLPWNEKGEKVQGSVEATSQVFVPSDRKFGTVNYWWQEPVVDLPRGIVESVAYASPTHETPVGQNTLVVYTPPRYDPRRSEPYPTLYLSHGGGGNEVDWSTQGDVPAILDNLIDLGQIQPMVVVMTNFNGYALNFPKAGWDKVVVNDIAGTVVSYVESHYNVAAKADKRAFAGLSAGGALSHRMLLDHGDSFGYFGFFSPGGGTLLSEQNTDQVKSFKNIGFFVGGGLEEPLSFMGTSGPRANAVKDVATLVAAGIAVTPDFIHGTHEWYVWRILLHDFLTRTAFWPATDRLADSSVSK